MAPATEPATPSAAGVSRAALIEKFRLETERLDRELRANAEAELAIERQLLELEKVQYNAIT